MTDAVIAEIKSRIAELTPKMEEASRKRDSLKAIAEAAAKPYEEARSRWCAIYMDIDQLQKMLPAEVVSEALKPEALPF